MIDWLDRDDEYEHLTPEMTIFNKEIARELLIEEGADATDELVDRILEISPNPWDAAILYKVLQRTGKL